MTGKGAGNRRAVLMTGVRGRPRARKSTQEEAMAVTVNGKAVDGGPGLSVRQLVETLTEATRGVAVAVNGAVVPRSAWEKVAIADGDAVEVLSAAQGG
jgi:sulfur carrier protein